MTTRTQARPYAKALFTLACEQQDCDLWTQRLEKMVAVAQNPVVFSLIRNQAISVTILEKFFLSLLEKLGDTPGEDEKRLIQMLSRNKRLFVLLDIYKLYQRYRAQKEKTITVTIQTAKALSKSQAQTLTQTLSDRFAKTVLLDVVIEPALLGGLIIKAGNQIMDLSIQGQLKTLYERISK